MSDPDLEPEPSIVLGIPGKWKDHSEIVALIARGSGGHIFAGNILMHIASKTSFELDVYDHDPELPEKVRWGSVGQIPEEDLAALEDHTFTLYLLSYETGRDVVERMMDAAVALLDSGGLLVKVESAGFSVSAAKWREYTSVKAAYSLQRAMVMLVGEEREYFTCGMRAFGLPDCMILDRDLDTAFETSIEFCCYMMDESPKFADGHLVKLTESPTRYRLSFEDYTHYPPDDPFHNPHGQWVLEPVKEH